MDMTHPLNRANWPKLPAQDTNKWIMAVDLGQSIDPTAICVLNYRVEPLETWTPDEKKKFWRQDRKEHFDVRHLQRLQLGIPYPAQVAQVAELFVRPPLNAGAALVIDETGVGRAVGDIFLTVGLTPFRITITSGNEATQHGGLTWHVPKPVLISSLEARMHTGEFGIAEQLKEAGALVDELKDFHRKVSEAGRASFNARSGAHDDLVLACAIAVWFATNAPKSSQQPLPWGS
jgi:hypothetical protein